jgi:chromate transporter
MLINLFLTFFKIGAFTFGGGYAMIPIIQREIVENKKLIEDEEFMDAIALAQASPGPIAVNTSIYVGYRIKGFFGAVACTLGTVLPSFITILLIAIYFYRFRENAIIDKVFRGIRPAIVALILSAVYKMWTKGTRSWNKVISSLLALTAVLLFKISPIWIVLTGAVVSVLYHKFYSPPRKNSEH